MSTVATLIHKILFLLDTYCFYSYSTERNAYIPCERNIIAKDY